MLCGAICCVKCGRKKDKMVVSLSLLLCVQYWNIFSSQAVQGEGRGGEGGICRVHMGNI